MAGVTVSVLGAVSARRADRELDLGAPQQRALLALLAVNVGSVVPLQAIVDAFWPHDPPASAVKVIQTYVSRLRRILGPETIERQGSGYALRIPSEAIDLCRFERLVRHDRSAEALNEWRGPPLADVSMIPGLRPEIDRLEELRMRALEQRVHLDIAEGRHADVIGELRALIAAHPLRERLRGLLMLALYRSGRQAEAVAVYRAARSALVEELGIEPGAELKQLERQILAQDSALSHADVVPGGTLPKAATSFVGRERELSEVGVLLARSDVRLLTLTGPGGIGKTRLAAHVAERAGIRYTDGVSWAALASLRDHRAVLETAGYALGTKEDLAAHIGERRLLLVLDNFEHVIDAAPLLSELLADCPNLNLLVTSREVLGLPGEQVYRVPPLIPEEAAELFVARARSALPGFADSALVPRLCATLDNLPLALELAAARVSLLSPEQLLGRLEGRLDLLRAGRGVNRRQQSMRTTIDWSYELLNASERRLFALLAVFRGSFTLDAAEAVCGAELDILESLVNKSLVTFQDGRFRMLQAIRDYAVERLDASGERDEVEQRHAEHYGRLAQTAIAEVGDDLVGRLQSWRTWIGQEHADIDAARAWAQQHGEGEYELCLAYVLAWLGRGGRTALASLDAALNGSGSVSQHLRGRALTLAAGLAYRCGDMGQARARAERAAEAATESGDAGQLARALNILAISVAHSGDLRLARRHYMDAIAHARAVEDDHTEARIILQLGDLALYERDYADARSLFAQATDLFAALEDGPHEAFALANGGVAAFQEGAVTDALSMLARALRMAAETESTVYVAYSLEALGDVLAHVGDYPRAANALGAAEAIREAYDMPLEPFEQGMHERAEALLREALGAAVDSEMAAGRARDLDTVVADALEGCDLDVAGPLLGPQTPNRTDDW